MTGTYEDGLTTGRISRRRLLGGAGLTAAAVIGSGSVLSACGGGSTGGPQAKGGASGAGAKGSGAVTWASWANPGEAERFKKYSTDYAKKTGGKISYQTVTGTYATKLVTQLAGGSAPDAFYVGDDLMAKAIQSGSVMGLDDFLASSDATVKTADMIQGLLPWCKKDGKIYGLPVDCNPKVFWFNKQMLTDAGFTTDPAALQEAGTWNQAALDDLLTKVKATGKKGLVFEANWFELCGWITALGGKAVDDTGKAIFDTDQKALDIISWLFDHMNAGTITYGGSLPKGQGVDALFYGSQLATITYGRWILPNVRKLKNFTYDIAPLPSASGKDIAETAVYCAAMAVNTKAKDQAAALKFATDFVNADGQRYRLSGGGNAVPCIGGLEDVVTEGGLPAHASWFTEVAKKGYTTPQVLVENPAAASNFSANLNTLFLSKPDYKTFATKAAALMNGKA